MASMARPGMERSVDSGGLRGLSFCSWVAFRAPTDRSYFRSKRSSDRHFEGEGEPRS